MCCVQHNTSTTASLWSMNMNMQATRRSHVTPWRKSPQITTAHRSLTQARNKHHPSTSRTHKPDHPPPHSPHTAMEHPTQCVEQDAAMCSKQSRVRKQLCPQLKHAESETRTRQLQPPNANTYSVAPLSTWEQLLKDDNGTMQALHCVLSSEEGQRIHTRPLPTTS